MDFEVTYTPEQEAFRAEVRAWLADNIPEGLEVPIDAGFLSYEQYQKSRELGRRLGAKGWLYPTYPKEYGGGDLSVDFVMILEEELDRYDMSLPPYYDSGGRLGGASIFVWGSEEQKQAFFAQYLPRRMAHLATVDRAERRFRPGRGADAGGARRG